MTCGPKSRERRERERSSANSIYSLNNRSTGCEIYRMIFIGCPSLIQYEYRSMKLIVLLERAKFDLDITSMGWQTIFRQRSVSFGLMQYRTLFGISAPKPPFPFGLQNKTQHYAEQRLLG